MNSDWVKIAVDIIQFLIMGVIGVWGYLRGKDSKNEEAVSELRAQLEAHIKTTNDRLTRIETGLAHVATSTDMATLEGRINTLAARVESVDSHLEQIRHSNNRIEKYLLENTRHA